MAKKMFEMEFVFRASPTILFNFLTTPSGLAQWFADDVDILEGTYTFIWSGTKEEADEIDRVENELLRLRWKGAPEEEYVEFKIEQSEVTGDTILRIFDFCEPDEVDNQRMLWESQVSDLHVRIGG